MLGDLSPAAARRLMGNLLSVRRVCGNVHFLSSFLEQRFGYDVLAMDVVFGVFSAMVQGKG